MTIVPFVCLGAGIFVGIVVKGKAFSRRADMISTVALVFLMISIGLGIGLDPEVANSLTKIGLHCTVISISAIVFSVVFTLICETTVLPLSKIDDELRGKKLDLKSANLEVDLSSNETREEDKKDTGLVWIMPTSLILGLIIGMFARKWISPSLVDKTFVFFLAILYVCVGISQGANREVFKYVKALGLRILWLPVAILCGSLVGGFISGMVLGLPLSITMVAAGGMSFYSITGAFMTSTYGLKIGTYGFIVNVMREVFTILLMPILTKISIGSPIAGGAAGNMDTMLAPITKFVGIRLGLVTLITGTILTFVVPFLLPLLASILQ